MERLHGLGFTPWQRLPESGSLIVADLTAYTAYLSRGELEHAPTIAGDLLETISRRPSGGRGERSERPSIGWGP